MILSPNSKLTETQGKPGPGRARELVGRGTVWASARAGAFTLIELLVVIAIIAILASLLLPTLSRAKERARHAQCISNQRQLGLTAFLYADDFNDSVPRNGYLSDEKPPDESLEELLAIGKLWVVGATHLRPEFYTNVSALMDTREASFASYIRSASLYKCPSDREKLKIGQRSQARLRSYSMNSYFGWTWPAGWNDASYKEFHKMTDLSAARPAGIFLFADMNPASICHSGFVVTPRWFYHLPFTGHNGSGVLAYADGHVESHRWKERDTIAPGYDLLNHFGGKAKNKDLDWLLEHASIRK